MTDINIRQVSKFFGPIGVLKDISLDICSGEFLVLVGPSGCGKSTLLRIISGLEQTSLGEIWIGGRDVTDLPAKQRDIAMVFQSYALYPHMTVADNMGFSLKLRGESRAVIDERVHKAAETLGLTEYLSRKPAALSGGQRQRVAMGRAIVRDPKVFLFDEPLSNLDAKLRVAMRTEIKALHRRLRTTTIYVTHDQVEAMTMADRIVVLRAGIVEQVGTPLELFDRPANTFVAEFIGSPAMNLLPGIVQKGMAALDIGTKLPLPKLAKLEDGRPIVVGVRPEHFRIDKKGIGGRIEIIEPLGSQTQMVLSAGNAQLTATFNERLSVEPGTMLTLLPAEDHVHLFDGETGQRIAL
jgi:multiple sugar transport system ATP-binding protein